MLRSLLFHRRGNVAVLLGVALGTAVLTGALLVGDSLRGSLRALALEQLGWVDQALVSPRFFRQSLVNVFADERAMPAILLQGSATNKAAGTVHRAGRVAIWGVDWGVDGQFWSNDN